MRVTATTDLAASTAADTIAVGLLADERIHHDTDDGALGALVAAGEAKAARGHLAVTHAGGRRWILVGLGARATLDDEVLRVAAAKVQGRARELGTRTLCWELPHKLADTLHPARAVVEGTLLAAYRFTAYKSKGQEDEGEDDDTTGGVAELIVSDHDDRTAAVSRAAVVAEAVNAARDLQNTPPNHLTPTALGRRGQAIAAAHDTVTCEVRGRAGIDELGMGAFSAVAQGSDEEPALIVARYEPPSPVGPVLGYVGKGITFDSGGLAIKPAGSMVEMKYDMSGGAAVLEALDAIAALRLPVRIVAVVGASENLLGGSAMKPGDVVTAASGTTIQLDNPDAEGRLVLADCLHHAVGLGAERLIDVATLTGAILGTLGKVYSGYWADDDAWAAQLETAAAEAGEPVWRLPLHERFAEVMKGRTADLTNLPPARTGGSSAAAAFLNTFTGGVPWAHLDIAGTAWDTGRPYFDKGGSGVMVRTLVALAERVAAEG